MIKISRLADYALVMLHDLSESPERCLSAAALARRTGIALPTVSKVLKLLHEAALITSIRGAAGGYQLAKKPEKMSVAEVISAVDGAPALTECCQSNHDCVHDTRCRLQSHWQWINRLITNVLAQLSLADLKKPVQLTQEIPIKFYHTEPHHVR